MLVVVSDDKPIDTQFNFNQARLSVSTGHSAGETTISIIFIGCHFVGEFNSTSAHGTT